MKEKIVVAGIVVLFALPIAGISVAWRSWVRNSSGMEKRGRTIVAGLLMGYLACFSPILVGWLMSQRIYANQQFKEIFLLALLLPAFLSGPISAVLLAFGTRPVKWTGVSSGVLAFTECVLVAMLTLAAQY